MFYEASPICSSGGHAEGQRRQAGSRRRAARPSPLWPEHSRRMGPVSHRTLLSGRAPRLVAIRRRPPARTTKSRGRRA
eukprot:scaffold57300_cov69-Phaeocystis_antarctica.AAC.3